MAQSVASQNQDDTEYRAFCAMATGETRERLIYDALNRITANAETQIDVLDDAAKGKIVIYFSYVDPCWKVVRLSDNQRCTLVEYVKEVEAANAAL